MELGEEFDIRIDRLGINGEGVGSFEGFTVFVDGGLPGEKARICLYEKRSNFGRGRILKLLETSSYRVEPICPLFGKCGGCQLMHLQYQKQLEAKRQRVVDALERIGKLFSIDVQPCEPSPTPLSYRNKIQLPVGPDASLGLYAYNSHDLVPIETCHIHGHLGEKAFQHIRCLLKRFPIEGLLHVLIKSALHTSQVLVVLVTNGEGDFEQLAQEIMEGMPEIRGVVENINTRASNAVLGSRFEILAGSGFIEEGICGLLFKVSPASFFQVNPAQAEKLYTRALVFASLQGNETVLDAYCGVGTLSLIFARHAKEVIGVECVSDAIEDAKENASRNHIDNARFICAKAESFIASLSTLDVAILNPPRKGCESSFLEKLASLKPSRIIYISCDPATLARDLAFLKEKGYSIAAVQPFDMFPQTAHVETIVSLKSAL